LVRRAAVPLLALTVAAVLADSAIVTLALPAILRHFDATVWQVAWVLIAFNLVLALVVVPAAWLFGRRDATRLCAAGMLVFAGASTTCALAGSIGVLIGARCVQALGGAFALVGCLELLVAASGERRGVAIWIGAGVVGTAAGPVAGGLLTESISWQAIFVVQVPIAVLAIPAALTIRGFTAQPPDRHGPAILPNLALILLSAALTAALFLLVLLLVDGWGRSPAIASLTVSVVPLSAFAVRPLVRLVRAGPRSEAAAGCLLIAGGLTALALPPSANLAWTIAPQMLIGFGVGLTLDSLTFSALRDRFPRALHGGWTIGARHAGVVLALAILTPVFTADLRAAQTPAQEAITALVLDAPLRAEHKIALANGLSEQLMSERGRVPDLRPAFAALQLPPGERRAGDELERDLNNQLERAATSAFRDSFLIGSGMALLALIPLIPPRRHPTRRPVS
jgi:predicted MFS family arabinose efflux permease